jgi:hypothetical protein
MAAARFNAALVEALLARVQGGSAAGVRDRNVTVVRVPGSNELPVAAACWPIPAARTRSWPSASSFAAARSITS